MKPASQLADAAPGRTDALIIGAGVIGSSLAWQLAQRGLSVLVVDPDLAGPYSSSERNAGGVRATWWQEVNIALCHHAINHYASVAERVGFRQRGYLWMHGPETWGEACAKISLQNAFGLEIQALRPEEIPARLPFVDRLEGVAGATFSRRDGLINPNLLKEHYREKARAAGAQLLDGARVASLHRYRKCFEVGLGAIPREQASAETPPASLFDGGGAVGGEAAVTVTAEVVINVAGAWAPLVASLYGASVPTRPVRRQISLVACRDVDLSPFGMIVDSTGLYFHAEGENILAGYSIPDEPTGYRYAYEGDPFFEREIWPRLYARSGYFERVRHVGGWAGLYALTPDRSAILGAVPGHPGIYESHSYSGRGVMQSYGAAVALAELITTGSFQTVDASALGGDRFEKGRLVYEELHI